jgi:adenine-specific DNA glycosylase
LYSLPEFESEHQWRHFISEHINDASPTPHSTNDIKHSFTHFDLRITPVYLCYTPVTLDQVLARLSLQGLETDGSILLGPGQARRYHAEARSTTLGLPAPVQNILEQIPASLMGAHPGPMR